MKTAEGFFQFTRWEESAYSEPDIAPKLTQARISNDFHGDIEGSSDLVYVMSYNSDDMGTFVGYEQVPGRLSDPGGPFVVGHAGAFADGPARGALRSVPGSRAGARAGGHGAGGGVGPPRR